MIAQENMKKKNNGKVSNYVVIDDRAAASDGHRSRH
jgi:hypothetical protein